MEEELLSILALSDDPSRDRPYLEDLQLNRMEQDVLASQLHQLLAEPSPEEAAPDDPTSRSDGDGRHNRDDPPPDATVRQQVVEEEDTSGWDEHQDIGLEEISREEQRQRGLLPEPQFGMEGW